MNIIITQFYIDSNSTNNFNNFKLAIVVNTFGIFSNIIEL